MSQISRRYLFDTVDADLSEKMVFISGPRQYQGPPRREGRCRGRRAYLAARDTMPRGHDPLTEHIKKLKQSGIYFRLVTTHMGARASEIVKAAKLP